MESNTLRELRRLYPGALLIDTAQAAQILNINPKTIRNLGDRFPVAGVKIGRSRRFPLAAIAALIDGKLADVTQQQREIVEDQKNTDTPCRRGPGRPRKVGV